MNNPRIVILAMAFVFFTCATALALPNALTFQLRTYALIIPAVGIGYSLPNGDALEINYTNFSIFGQYTYLAFVYSLQLTSSENYRTAFDFGLMSYDYNESGGGGFWIGGPGPATPPSHASGIYPVILYEQERSFGRDLSWMINVGYPNLIGLGLKYYLQN